MSSRSTRSSASQASTSSSATMTSVATHTSTHPYLTPGRASTISSWQLSLPERHSQSHTSSEAEEASRQATVEAYQQLKMSAKAKSAKLNQLCLGSKPRWLYYQCTINIMFCRRQTMPYTSREHSASTRQVHRRRSIECRAGSRMM
jgi:hypothetical protein